jgi:hypothetical protein
MYISYRVGQIVRKSGPFETGVTLNRISCMVRIIIAWHCSLIKGTTCIAGFISQSLQLQEQVTLARVGHKCNAKTCARDQCVSVITGPEEPIFFS